MKIKKIYLFIFIIAIMFIEISCEPASDLTLPATPEIYDVDEFNQVE